MSLPGLCVTALNSAQKSEQSADPPLLAGGWGAGSCPCFDVRDAEIDTARDTLFIGAADRHLPRANGPIDFANLHLHGAAPPLIAGGSVVVGEAIKEGFGSLPGPPIGWDGHATGGLRGRLAGVECPRGVAPGALIIRGAVPLAVAVGF